MLTVFLVDIVFKISPVLQHVSNSPNLFILSTIYHDILNISSEHLMSLSVVTKMNSGRMSPVRSRTMKEYDSVRLQLTNDQDTIENVIIYNHLLR